MVCASGAFAQTASEVLGPAAVVPLSVEQPPARIIVDQPLAEPLAQGLVVIQYRTENLRIVPVFGTAALAVSPRIGHVHVAVDDLPWDWAAVSGDSYRRINARPVGSGAVYDSHAKRSSCHQGSSRK